MPAKSNPHSADKVKLINKNGLDGRVPITRFVLFLCLAIGGAALDLITKSYMFDRFFEPEIYYFKAQQKHWLIGEFFGIQCSTNPGALFGFGSGYSSVFAIISVVAIGAIFVWLFVLKNALDRWMNFALGLITGGILGNLYDRIGLGYRPEYPADVYDNVRDWILFELEGVPFFDPWPNFNIADCLLVVGAMLLFLHSIVAQDLEQNSVVNSINRNENRTNTGTEASESGSGAVAGS